MNTPAHLIIAATAFGRPNKRAITIAAIIGALVPDVSLYAMVAWSIFVQGISPDVVFGSYYYSSTWQRVFAVDNSFVLWGIGLGFAIWSKRPVSLAFAGAGLLHLALDFPFHNHDARMHFWPLTDWVFISPYSYWDRRFHADIIGPLELGLSLALSAVLIRRFKGIGAWALIALVVILEILANGVLARFF